MINSELADIFEEIADMLSVDDGVSRFEVLAYRKAAQTLSGLQESVLEIYKKGGIAALMELPGIGKGISSSIKEYIDTGRMEKFEKLKKRYPVDFKTLTKIQGLGAKKVFKLYTNLRVRNLDDLKRAAEDQSIRKLAGFGAKSEIEIRNGITLFESSKGRMALGTALPEAELIIRKLSESGLVDRAAIAGSTRRMRETVGDLDLLVTSKRPPAVMDFIAHLDEVADVVLRGPTKTTLRLKIGINCDVRVVDPISFGAALQYFTGNKDHNVKGRQVAIRLGYKLNEYGLFDKKGRNVAGLEEKDIYDRLGMDIMDPEMREDRGEVQLSLKHKLPKVVEMGDILGDLHTHTNHSDGSASIIEMAQAAKKIGHRYIGITDHSKSEYIAHGMDDRKFAKHFAEIDKVNDKLDGITLLKSSEIDILKDGRLDLSKKTLDAMDYRLAAVHQNLGMDKASMTKRIITALESGNVDILAHPTDRLINARGPISFDLDKVFQAAEDNSVALEINGNPGRLDLNDENIIKAREYRVMFSIDTDSHSTTDLMFMRYGVSTAKRGWLSSERGINSMGIEGLLKHFNKGK